MSRDVGGIVRVGKQELSRTARLGAEGADADAERRREGRRKGCSPVAVQLLDPVHDEAQAQARRADGQQLRLLVVVNRQELFRWHSG